MLVLQREKNQHIDITLPDGRVITIQVVEFRQTQRSNKQAVRLGIEAPRDITVHRREITERIAAIHEEMGNDNG